MRAIPAFLTNAELRPVVVLFVAVFCAGLAIAAGMSQ